MPTSRRNRWQVIWTGKISLIVRRTYSVPEHVTLFCAGAAAVGSVYPLIVAHTGGRGLPCPLRTLTGVPCPFCGLTTATAALTHGSWAAAAAASPLAYLAAGLAIGTAPVLVARAAGRAAAPRAWSAAARRRARWSLAVVVALSWIFQLHRFGFL
jgi:Protein of unknown function (DUF2752)